MICDQSTGQMYKHGSWSPPIEMAGGHSKKSLQAEQTAPNKASARGNLAWYTLGNHHVEARWEAAFPPPIVKEMAVLCDTRSTFCQLYSLYWLRLELFLIWIFTAGLWSMGNSIWNLDSCLRMESRWISHIILLSTMSWPFLNGRMCRCMQSIAQAWLWTRKHTLPHVHLIHAHVLN